MRMPTNVRHTANWLMALPVLIFLPLLAPLVYGLPGGDSDSIEAIANSADSHPSPSPLSSNPTDVTSPSGQVTSPANGSIVTLDSTFSISGTANDDSSGVSRVFVRLQRRGVYPKTYWNGSEWQNSLSGTFLRATLDSEYNWTLDGIDLSQHGTYRVTLKVRDFARNTSTTQNPYLEFSTQPTDNTPPSGHVIHPATGATVSPDSSYTISGTSADDISGVSRVFVRVQRRDVFPKTYWNGSEWQTSLSGTFHAATLDSDYNWALNGIDLSQPGTYRVTLKARDFSRNISTIQNPYSQFLVADNTNHAGLTVNLDTNQATLDANTDPAEGLSFKLNDKTILSNDTSFKLISLPTQNTADVKGDFQKTPNGYKQSASIEQLDASIELEYLAKGDYLEIIATLSSNSDNDRAWRLQLPLSLQQSDWVWSPNPVQKFPLDSSNSDPSEAARYPLTTLVTDEDGLAIAVPVSAPAVVDYKRNDTGEFVVEFSLGTSPETSHFPNSASVKLHLWRVDPKLGFRQSLDDQYKRNTDIFERRYSAGGAWQSGTSDRLYIQSPFKFHRHGNVFFSLDDSSALPLSRQIEIDQTFDQLTFQYLIPGQMSHVQLDELPADHTDIDKFLSLRPNIFPPQQFQKYLDLGTNTPGYRNALETSRITSAKNEYELLIRETVVKGFDPENNELLREWRTMGNQVSFVVNPNPELVLSGKPGHGKQMMQWVENLVSQHPDLGGIYVDSLGLWGNYKNYRRDHFPFTKLPLASDADGKVYLPNSWGHYEFVRDLSNLLHDNNMLVMGNISGLTSAELYFLMSLPDIGFSERKHTSNNSLSYALRAATGPRLLVNNGKSLGSQLEVESFIYSRLAAGMIPSMRGSYYALPEWVNSDEEFATDKGMPNYLRDKSLWDAVYQITPQLSQATWSPITHASSSTTGITVERFHNDNGTFLTAYAEDNVTTSSASICLDKAHWKTPPAVATELLTDITVPFTSTASCWTLDAPLSGTARKLGIVWLQHR